MSYESGTDAQTRRSFAEEGDDADGAETPYRRAPGLYAYILNMSVLVSSEYSCTCEVKNNDQACCTIRRRPFATAVIDKTIINVSYPLTCMFHNVLNFFKQRYSDHNQYG